MDIDIAIQATRSSIPEWMTAVATIFGGGLIAALLTYWLNNRSANAEVRRKAAVDVRHFKANRVLNASATIRQAFFAAKAEVDFLALSLKNIEDAHAAAKARMEKMSGAALNWQLTLQFSDSCAREKYQRRELYNQQVRDWYAKTASAIDSLDVLANPEEFAAIPILFAKISQTWEFGQEADKQELYNSSYKEMDRLLKAMDAHAYSYAEDVN